MITRYINTHFSTLKKRGLHFEEVAMGAVGHDLVNSSGS